MEELYVLHNIYLNNLEPTYRRGFKDEIDWSNRLIAIKGPRGVGKSTMILQHIKETFSQEGKALYVTLDSLALKETTISDIAKYHYEHGGTHLFLDEVHKYEHWSQEVKNVYDLLPRLKVVITSSSILQIYKSYADLSRRLISYDMHGLSFREYLQITNKVNLDTFSIAEIANNHTTIAQMITAQINVLPHFTDYLRSGYYPFFLENKNAYLTKLNNTINLTLDVDLPYILGISVHNIFKIKKLIHQLATEVPFKPNVSKLAGSLELTRSTLNSYIHYLDQACILNLLMDSGKSYSNISKPEKIFLNNTNLSYAISPSTINRGTLRETFFFNQVANKHNVSFTKHGDFLVDEKYTFDIVGRKKNNKQIYDVPNSYIAADEIILGAKNKIPLWLFGFLY